MSQWLAALASRSAQRTGVECYPLNPAERQFVAWMKSGEISRLQTAPGLHPYVDDPVASHGTWPTRALLPLSKCTRPCSCLLHSCGSPGSRRCFGLADSAIHAAEQHPHELAKTESGLCAWV